MDEIRETLIGREVSSKYNAGRWITDEEANFLCSLIKQYKIKEVYESGTANGFSACKMAQAGASVTTFDPVKRPHVWDEPEFVKYKEIITWVNDGFETLELEPIRGNRLFFIDGDHGLVGAGMDRDTVLRYFKRGDVMVFHDFNEKAVVKTWQRMDKKGWHTHIEPTRRIMAVLTKNEGNEETLFPPKSTIPVSDMQRIAATYGTDKKQARHNYVDYYNELFTPFRNEPIKFLEIGVYLCRSHNLWVDWFPNATIYGIDINDSRFNKYARARLVLDNVDQSDAVALKEYAEKKGPWRIILDDGSHKTSHQNISFDVLWDYVEPGGYYIIEDTFTSYWDKFIDSDLTLVDKMLALAEEISSSEMVSNNSQGKNKRYYSNIEVRDLLDDVLTKNQREIESVEFRMGVILVRKRKVGSTA